MVRISIKNKKLKILFAIAFIIFFAVLIYEIWPKPIYSISYDGGILTFRADLKEANKVPVYPSEEILYQTLINPSVENVTIVFVPVEGENAIYVVNAFEIVSKLYPAYQKIGVKPKFNGINLTSYENVELYGKIQNPYIVLIHPRFANETSVRLKDHTVFISGKSNQELDKATVKFLMVALKIRI
jgi:uncharacterized protein YpmB